jgi:hypothetical protein
MANDPNSGPTIPVRQEELQIVVIRKLKSGQYRIYSRTSDPRTGKGRNLGTFPIRKEAEAHERAIQ